MRILFYIIPLLPFIFYFIYFSHKHRKLRKDEILVGLKNGPWVKLVFASLLSLIAIILFFTFTNLEPQGENYVPARFENGELIPDRFE